MSLLTLDHLTLFYRSLSDPSLGHIDEKQKHDGVKKWCSAIRTKVGVGSKLTSQASSSITTGSRASARSSTPSLVASVGRSSTPSVLTDNVMIISQPQSSSSAKVKLEPAPPICLHDNGGLSDYDETRGEEREAAIISPIKGKKRVVSEVCKYFYLIQ